MGTAPSAAAWPAAPMPCSTSTNRAGGEVWLTRARELADRAAASIERTAESPDSLFKGAVGVAVLAADLAAPETAVFPFFEEEGWRGQNVRQPGGRLGGRR